MYAHSGVLDRGIRPQLYKDHIKNMLFLSERDNVFLPPPLREVVRLSILYHDIGKLSDNCQMILKLDDTSGDKMENHVDAGVSYCIKQYEMTQNEVWIYTAYFIHGHHIGFGDFPELFNRNFDTTTLLSYFIPNLTKLRDHREINGVKFSDYIDTIIPVLVDRSRRLMPEINHDATDIYIFSDIRSIDLRMALSIFSDADHLDTSHHYGLAKRGRVKVDFSKTLSECRNHSIELQKTAENLGVPKQTIKSRSLLFDLTNDIDTSKGRFFRCSAPTGKGKTLALFNLAIRIATEKNKERIFNIIPFTNIISQTASEYRKVVKNSHIINEIHSRVEYSSHWAKKYSQLWDRPINVSTSVQFFESLFSNRPSRMRKIKEFANSVIILDEYHTSIPHYLWIPTIPVLKDLSDRYNVDFIFGSGSPANYWDIGLNNKLIDVIEVVPDKIQNDFIIEEDNRITFESSGIFINDDQLLDHIKSLIVDNEEKLNKSTLIITNTISNAVGITRKIDNWKLKNGIIYHLTSFMTPRHRDIILERVKRSLDKDEKIILISTSIIECGVDFSFEIGFRERGSLMSAIQTGGRVNRGGEFRGSKLYEFEFSKDFYKGKNNIYTYNYGLLESILSRKNLTTRLDNCSIAIENEIVDFGRGKGEPILNGEQTIMFNSVDRDYRVINNDSVQVIICRKIIDKMKRGININPTDISKNSISVGLGRLESKFAEHYKEVEITNDDIILQWVGNYCITYGIGCVI